VRIAVTPLMHVCASALTAVRRTHVNAASMMPRPAADDSSKALKEGRVKKSGWKKQLRIR
jgi:hypothetical protein